MIEPLPWWIRWKYQLHLSLRNCFVAFPLALFNSWCSGCIANFREHCFVHNVQLNELSSLITVFVTVWAFCLRTLLGAFGPSAVNGVNPAFGRNIYPAQRNTGEWRIHIMGPKCPNITGSCSPGTASSPQPDSDIESMVTYIHIKPHFKSVIRFCQLE